MIVNLHLHELHPPFFENKINLSM